MRHTQNRRNGTFSHGFTFGGHPVSAAISLETLKIIERRNLISHAKSMELLFKSGIKRLADFSFVKNVRGTGLLYAFDLDSDAAGSPKSGNYGARFAVCAEKNGLIVRGLGNKVIICPPIIIKPNEIDELLDLLVTTLIQGDWHYNS